jgi:UDP-3-O-[3-hydroxymyristoyl] glucosamine N-acyltransferase
MRLSELAAAVGGTVDGDGGVVVGAVSGLQEAMAGDVSFLANPKYAPLVQHTHASAVIVARDFAGERPCALIRVDNPDKAFTQAALMLSPKPVQPQPGIHPTAVIAADAAIGKDVGVGPYCVVEPGARIGDRSILGSSCYIGHGCSVGEDCRFHPHVTLREHVTVGNRVIIHNGAVIGSDGFGYYRQGEAWVKIPQVGVVVIGDDVEIGANTTVDRARFGRTVIGRGTKIDNLVQIAHNVQVGEHVAMAAQVGISGSARVGRGVQLAGQVGVAGHLAIGDGAVVLAQSGVSKDVPAGAVMFDSPAMPQGKAARLHAHVARLPELKERVAELERRIRALEARGPAGTPSTAGGSAP